MVKLMSRYKSVIIGKLGVKQPLKLLHGPIHVGSFWVWVERGLWGSSWPSHSSLDIGTDPSLPGYLVGCLQAVAAHGTLREEL